MIVYKKNILIFSLIVLFFSLSTIIPAQNNNTAEMSLTFNIPSIALIDFAVDGSQMITYSFSYSTLNQVEQIITPTTADKTWLNYSSVIGDLTNYITAHISSGSLPADVSLYVLIGNDAGAGDGIIGTSVGQITLSSFPQNIITDIGSCYTGRGIYKGHQLTYIWENPESYNYSINFENGYAIAVTYTITSTE